MTENRIPQRRNSPQRDFQSRMEQSPEESNLSQHSEDTSTELYEKSLAEPASKIKGKVILTSGDGNRRVRPPLTQLMQVNSKLAWYCFKEEIPKIAYLWWDKRHPAHVYSLIIGLVVSLIVGLGWTYVIPLLGGIEQIPQTKYNAIILYCFTMVSAATSFLAGLIMFSLGVKDIFVTKKEFGGLTNLRREGTMATVLSFLKISLFYGPVFVIIAIVSLFFGLLSFAGAVAKAT